MSVLYPQSIINPRLQVVENAMDAAATPGVLRLLDSHNNILSSLTLAQPAGTVSGGVLGFNGLSLIDPSAAGTGAIVAARIEDGNGNVVASGLTAGGPGAATDIVFSPTNVITAGQAVALQQAQITGH